MVALHPVLLALLVLPELLLLLSHWALAGDGSAADLVKAAAAWTHKPPVDLLP
jgi:hypothetical protein